MYQLPAVPSTKPCVSDRCCVWQVATPAFTLVVGEAEGITGSGAVVDVWTWGDAVEVCTGNDELDGEGLDGERLDGEEHPASNDALSSASPVTIGIEFFISPTIHQRWERFSQIAHPRTGKPFSGIFRYRCVVGWDCPTVTFRCLGES